MPSRAFCILFDKLPHAPSAGIYSEIDVHTHTPTSAGKSAFTHVCRDERDEHKSRSARTGAMHHGVRAIDGCLLQLTCERRAARSHARYVHLDGERSLSARARCTNSRPSLAISVREGGNDINPWWMLHPSGIANISRDATTSTRRHRRPPSTISQWCDAMRSGMYAARHRLSRRIHPPRNDDTASIDLLRRASTWQWSVIRLI